MLTNGKTPRENDTLFTTTMASKKVIEDTALEVYAVLIPLLKKAAAIVEDNINLDGFNTPPSDMATVMDSITAHEQNLKLINADLAEAWRIVEDCQNEFKRRKGWSRFWQEVSPTGHVHASKHCSACLETTEYVLLSEYSGSADAKVVTLAGSSTCTICFHDAPADMITAPSRLENPVKRKARMIAEAKEARKNESQ